MTQMKADPRAITASWLVVLNEADGLRWVLANSRMAFSARQTPRAKAISKGDHFFLYASRGAYHNPTRGESQLIALATVASAVSTLRRRQ